MSTTACGRCLGEMALFFLRFVAIVPVCASVGLVYGLLGVPGAQESGRVVIWLFFAVQLVTMGGMALFLRVDVQERDKLLGLFFDAGLVRSKIDTLPVPTRDLVFLIDEPVHDEQSRPAVSPSAFASPAPTPAPQKTEPQDQVVLQAHSQRQYHRSGLATMGVLDVHGRHLRHSGQVDYAPHLLRLVPEGFYTPCAASGVVQVSKISLAVLPVLESFTISFVFAVFLGLFAICTAHPLFYTVLDKLGKGLAAKVRKALSKLSHYLFDTYFLTLLSPLLRAFACQGQQRCLV